METSISIEDRIKKLSFTDDYMFGAVMKNKRICIGVLKRLLGFDIVDIEYPELQKDIRKYYSSKGVRLDVLVRTKDGNRVIDVEMQNRDISGLEMRTRYYQSMLDVDCLARGEDYNNLKESYILFILKGDHFDKGLPVYTFRNQCVESKGLFLDDKTYKIFYNSSSYRAESDEERRALLKYIETRSADDDFSNEINDEVLHLKDDEEFRSIYLAMNIHDTDKINEGREIGRKEGLAEGLKAARIENAINFLKLNLSPETIAKGTGLSLDEILAIAKKHNIQINQ